MPTRIDTHIFPCGEVSFVSICFYQVGLSNRWRHLFILPKLDGCQVVCQAAGDALGVVKFICILFHYNNSSIRGSYTNMFFHDFAWFCSMYLFLLIKVEAIVSFLLE
jgi:hypothetical protein